MERRTTGTFDKLAAALNAGPRYIDNRGGARSGKTFAELQLVDFRASLPGLPPILATMVTDTLPHLKRGAIRDFQSFKQDEGTWDESAWSKSECIYHYPNGSKLEFFGVDAPGKVQGPARDWLLINEANYVGWEAARQLMARTSGLIIYDYNPSAPFWGTEEIPKRDRYALVHSTYTDNNLLDPEVRREIEANRDSGNWWRVYGLGLIGQVEGQVFDFKVCDKMPEPDGFIESYGMDFGFSHDPTTLIRVLFHTGRREIYADELLWQTGMTNPEIAHALQGFGITRSGTAVFADAAEPKSISEIAGYGLNVQPCDKRTMVREQLQSLRAWTIYVTRRSSHLLDEGRKYLYKQRSDGTYTNEPIDFFNHGIDSLRYAVISKINNPGYAQYSLGFRGQRTYPKMTNSL